MRIDRVSYFMAQALDNASPNHFVLMDDASGEFEELQEPERQEEVYKHISLVATNGTVIFENGGVELIARESKSLCLYLLQVPSVEPDVAGRVAPILCYRAYTDGSLSLDEIAKISAGLQGFAASISRSIAPQTLADVTKAFEVAQKKRFKELVANTAWDPHRRAALVDASVEDRMPGWALVLGRRLERNAVTLWNLLRAPFVRKKMPYDRDKPATGDSDT